MATARNYSGPYYQQTMDRLNKLRDQTPGGPAPTPATPAAPMTGGFAGGRTTGYGGTRNYEPPRRNVGYGGGSTPFTQVPVPAPAAPVGPSPAAMPPQIAALLAMLGKGGQAPTPATMGAMLGGYGTAPGGLQTLNNGGYGAVPMGTAPQGLPPAAPGLQTLSNGGYGMAAPPNIGQIQAILAMLGGR